MRRLLLASALLLAAVQADAGVRRYRFQHTEPRLPSIPVPQFIVADLESELPGNDVREGDLAYAKDSDRLFKRISSAWTDLTSAQAVPVTVMSHTVFGRVWGFIQPDSLTAVALTRGTSVVGMPLPGSTGVTTVQAALSGTTRLYWQWASAATIGSIAGLSSVYIATRPAYRPKLTGIIRTDATIDTRRLWFALTDATIEAVTHATGPTASTVDFVGLGFDTSISANWRVCSGDGTNYSCADTGVSVAVSTEYTLTVDWSVEGTLTWGINAASGTKTTNLSTAATNMGLFNSITTLSATARNHQIAKMVLEQN